jgi:hypothetical protein
MHLLEAAEDEKEEKLNFRPLKSAEINGEAAWTIANGAWRIGRSLTAITGD